MQVQLTNINLQGKFKRYEPKKMKQNWRKAFSKLCMLWKYCYRIFNASRSTALHYSSWRISLKLFRLLAFQFHAVKVGNVRTTQLKAIIINEKPFWQGYDLKLINIYGFANSVQSTTLTHDRGKLATKSLQLSPLITVECKFDMFVDTNVWCSWMK